ncbi:hypothetical protein Nepgr_033134 [Nepenthes gracilis]|uniref:Uncharacterized protein n=1 Tax=Nepenthes gracilis TaxID=150966 RepID=A0AAD3Y8T4_NEPGR|nr:hypothetical protein Nepgr_033134 [Nepenthes gracilis]
MMIRKWEDISWKTRRTVMVIVLVLTMKDEETLRLLIEEESPPSITLCLGIGGVGSSKSEHSSRSRSRPVLMKRNKKSGEVDALPLPLQFLLPVLRSVAASFPHPPNPHVSLHPSRP